MQQSLHILRPHLFGDLVALSNAGHDSQDLNLAIRGISQDRQCHVLGSWRLHVYVRVIRWLRYAPHSRAVMQQREQHMHVLACSRRGNCSLKTESVRRAQGWCGAWYYMTRQWCFFLAGCGVKSTIDEASICLLRLDLVGDAYVAAAKTLDKRTATSKGQAAVSAWTCRRRPRMVPCVDKN